MKNQVPVYYCPKIDPDDRQKLQRLEATIANNCIAVFCNVSPVRWELDPEAVHQVYYRLMRDGGEFSGIEIGSWQIRLLERISEEEFLEALKETSYEFTKTERRLRDERKKSEADSKDGPKGMTAST